MLGYTLTLIIYNKITVMLYKIKAAKLLAVQGHYLTHGSHDGKNCYPLLKVFAKKNTVLDVFC